MEMETVIKKIVQYRNKRGFTYENMAGDLDLTPAAYRKIETGETKLTVERLFKIASILDTPVEDILGIGGNEMHQNNYNNENVYQQKIEHFYQENKELVEKLIQSKDTLIESLQREIEYLKSHTVK